MLPENKCSDPVGSRYALSELMASCRFCESEIAAKAGKEILKYIKRNSTYILLKEFNFKSFQVGGNPIKYILSLKRLFEFVYLLHSWPIAYFPCECP